MKYDFLISPLVQTKPAQLNLNDGDCGGDDDEDDGGDDDEGAECCQVVQKSGLRGPTAASGIFFIG